MSDIALTLQEYSIPELRYGQIQMTKGYIYDIRQKWEVLRPRYRDMFLKLNINPTLVLEEDRGDAILYERENLVVLADFEKNSVTWNFSSSDSDLIDREISLLKTVFPPVPESLEGKVKVRFWYHTQHGPRNVIRTIAVPRWEQITTNYNAYTLEGLTYLMKDYQPKAGGQLIIMHGQPGTGKSYSLRSLLYSWRDWCNAEYVLDPENLFSHSSGYLADLVLRNSYDEYEAPDDEESQGKWKLLILEDSGELLAVDAKERTGQGLSRLLNLVDGLIGQGLRVLVLITTNEELDKLHPAVSREGRCAAAIEFKTFNREQASKWMNGKAPELPDGKNEFTLSELYALSKEKIDNKFTHIEPKAFGFQPR